LILQGRSQAALILKSPYFPHFLANFKMLQIANQWRYCARTPRERSHET